MQAPDKGRYKWEVLGLLWLAFFINQADRQVFNVVLPLIRQEFHLEDVELGLIATAFNLVYAVLVLVAGFTGDRFSRKWIVVGSILFWSIATMLTGFATGMMTLILFRSLVGAGEAFFGPSNYSLLGSYHTSTRSRAMSIHQTSYYLGIIVSGYVAGYIGEHYGWRNAFYLFGAVGVLHGIVMIFRLKETRVAKGTEAAVAAPRVTVREALSVILTTPTALLLTLAFSGLIFVLVGYLTWTPTYLYEKFSVSLSAAGFQSMFFTHIAAFAGILLAGRISDRAGQRKPSVRLLMQAFGLLAATPFIVLMGNAGTFTLVYVGFIGFGFARAFFDANTYPVLFDVIPSRYHASAAGVMAMVAFSIGSVSPVILGYLKPMVGLSAGISGLAIVWVLCGILLLVAYKFYFNKDYNRRLAAEQQPAEG